MSNEPIPAERHTDSEGMMTEHADEGEIQLRYADGRVDRSEWPRQTLQIISRPYAHQLANALDVANAERDHLKFTLANVRAMLRDVQERRDLLLAERDSQARTIAELRADLAERRDKDHPCLEGAYDSLQEDCDALRAELAAATKDAERLDWLDDYCSQGNGRTLMACLPGALRATIDAAIATQKEQT